MDDDWTNKFLAVLAQGSTVEIAARAAGKDRSTCYRRRQADKDFAERWDDAKAAPT